MVLRFVEVSVLIVPFTFYHIADVIYCFIWRKGFYPYKMAEIHSFLQMHAILGWFLVSGIRLVDLDGHALFFA